MKKTFSEISDNNPYVIFYYIKNTKTNTIEKVVLHQTDSFIEGYNLMRDDMLNLVNKATEYDKLNDCNDAVKLSMSFGEREITIKDLKKGVDYYGCLDDGYLLDSKYGAHLIVTGGYYQVLVFDANEKPILFEGEDFDVVEDALSIDAFEKQRDYNLDCRWIGLYTNLGGQKEVAPIDTNEILTKNILKVRDLVDDKEMCLVEGTTIDSIRLVPIKDLVEKGAETTCDSGVTIFDVHPDGIHRLHSGHLYDDYVDQRFAEVRANVLPHLKAIEAEIVALKREFWDEIYTDETIRLLHDFLPEIKVTFKKLEWEGE